MAEITITFPDGSKKKFKKGVTPLEIAEGISKGLAKEAVTAKVNGGLWDLTRPIDADAKIEILKFDSKEAKEVFWHSTNHVLAEAVSELFPNSKLTIGPSIEEGFFYDFDVEKPFTPEDLEKIEQKMAEIIKKNKKFERSEVKKPEALKKVKGNPYKTEIIQGIEGDTVSFYKQNGFEDLCEGPHLPSTEQIGGFKLLKTSAAYWRGDSKNKSLQRVYGLGFPEKKQMDDWLHRREEAEKRNHIKLGKDLDLFSIHSESPGCLFMHAKGMAIWNSLIDFSREAQRKLGYQEVNTPQLMKKDLWLTSGHWEHYKQNMYITEIDKEEHALKPMNCPGHVLIYKTKRHSYRDLPLRIAEYGTVHRHELSGVLHGMFRVRKFTQDDAHLFCTPEQIKDEVIGVITLTDFFYKTFGFTYRVELSTRPDQFQGEPQLWDQAEKALADALKACKLDYKVNPGQGAFYGPKIDFHIEDCIGRTWQCATIQLDFFMPKKFDLFYIGADDKEHIPVMIHRAIFGSMERFMAVLIEHFFGAFPLWLAPVQVKIIPVTDKVEDYAKKVYQQMIEAGIRAELDLRKETVSYKVREASVQKVPFQAAVGEKEAQNGTLTIRDRSNKLKPDMKVADFIVELKEQIALRK